MMLELTGKDILALTNESKRKAVLADWQNWGIWHKAPETGLSVRITSTVRVTTLAVQTANSRQVASRKAC